MAKKLPKGYSVKTIREEKGFVDMYRWAIFKDGLKIKESYALDDCATSARNEGVKKLWKEIEDAKV